MTKLSDWLTTNVTVMNTRPLFAQQGLVVEHFIRHGLHVLRRHASFDELMIDTVEGGFVSETWRGIVYIMHWGTGEDIRPLYIGKTERVGKKHPISANLRNIRTNHNFFGRWGYRPAYHIGDLSLAVLGGISYKTAGAKYERWAQTLFTRYAPPTLRELVSVALVSWHDGMLGPSGLQRTVAAVEKELIMLAGAEHAETLLNTDGR